MLVRLTQSPAPGKDVFDRREGWCYFDGTVGQGDLPIEFLQVFSPADASGALICGFNVFHVARKCYAGVPGRQLVVHVENADHRSCTLK